MFIFVISTDAETFMQRLEACIRDIDIWTVKNRLKQNEEKTEFLYTHKAKLPSKHSMRPLQIGGKDILPAENVKRVTSLCSEGPRFRRFYVQKIFVQKVLCSEGSIFRRSYVQKVLYSESPMFRRSYVQKVLYSDMFRRSYIQKILCFM